MKTLDVRGFVQMNVAHLALMQLLVLCAAAELLFAQEARRMLDLDGLLWRGARCAVYLFALVLLKKSHMRKLQRFDQAYLRARARARRTARMEGRQ